MRKFGIMTHITFLGGYIEKGTSYSIGMHRLIGDKNKIKGFYNEFKKDKNVLNAQLNNNIMICTEKSSKLPIGGFKSKIFFQKPILIDKEGYEHWEFFSFERDLINQFITRVNKITDEFEIKSLKDTKLNDFYFPHAIPQLSDKQKRALELAMEKGYYSIPRKTTIRHLAELMKISKSAYNDLLRRAEGKILPDLLNMNLIE